MGISSNGFIEWTTLNGHGIFPYATAANAGAGLAGYTDWRIPNLFELLSICNLETASAVPNATYWTTWVSANQMWSSSTLKDDSTKAWTILYATTSTKVQTSAKNTAGGLGTTLVRGPN
jgi:hypothetical protein